MKNRRTFIKQLTAAGIASIVPSILLSQRRSIQPIRLLVRADDLGNTWGVNLGVIKSFKEGIVTSASLMPCSDFFEEAVRLAKTNPKLSIGVHITLMDVDTKTRPVLSPELVPSLVNPEGYLYETMDKFKLANVRVEEMEKEIRAQIEKVRTTGLKFVYLDNHMSVTTEAKEIINKICFEQRLVIGQMAGDGSLYGYKRLNHNVESWPRMVLPDGREVVYAAPELSKEKKKIFFDLLLNLEPGEKYMTAFHPGLGEPERISITELLCSPETKEIIKRKNIQLVSYSDVWNEEFGKNNY